MNFDKYYIDLFFVSTKKRKHMKIDKKNFKYVWL